MKIKRPFFAIATAALLVTGANVQAQYIGGWANPFVSKMEAKTVSEAAIVEMPLTGTGAFPMTWAGVAQFGNGPMQLVIELPRASKWLGTSCLKFITMHRKADAYVAVSGGYIFTFENAPVAVTGSYAGNPDANRFVQFERQMTIQKEDGVWEASSRMQGNIRQMRWTNNEGVVETRQDTVTAMKALQQTPHCTI